jgi:hypothetical protein
MGIIDFTSITTVVILDYGSIDFASITTVAILDYEGVLILPLLLL